MIEAMSIANAFLAFDELTATTQRVAPPDPGSDDDNDGDDKNDDDDVPLLRDHAPVHASHDAVLAGAHGCW